MLTIDEIKERIAPLCREYEIDRAFLFGSYARGEATEDSDVDIRIENQSPKLRTLFQVGELLSHMEAALQKKVDLLTSLPTDDWSFIFRKNILKDEVLIYETR